MTACVAGERNDVLSMVEAICSALGDEMERDERVIVLGEDVGKSGGVFRATDGLQQRFGAERVVDTPTAEAVIVGASIGLATAGLVPVAELQFLGFGLQAFHQIGHQLARWRYRTNGRYHAQVTIRAPYGGGVRAPELHSDGFEAVFAQMPGLKLVAPSTAADAKGMLLSAIRDPDPVLFLEPLRGYRLVRDEVPDGDVTVELGVGPDRPPGARRHGDRVERDGRSSRWRPRRPPPSRASMSRCSTCDRWCRSTSAPIAESVGRTGPGGGRPGGAAHRPGSRRRWWRRSRRAPSSACRRRSPACRAGTCRIRCRSSRTTTSRRSSGCSPPSAAPWSTEP